MPFVNQLVCTAIAYHIIFDWFSYAPLSSQIIEIVYCYATTLLSSTILLDSDAE